MKKTDQKGITLIALVVTIIVLLILAGIAVGMLRTDSSILSQSRNAKNETIHTKVAEQLNLEAMNYAIEKSTDETSKTLIEYLLDKEILKEIDGETNKWQIDVEKLLGAGQTMGKGIATSTDKKDVYVLEESVTSGKLNNMKFASTMPLRIAVKASIPKTYVVVYYGNNGTSGGPSVGQRLEIGNVADSEEMDVGIQPDGTFITRPGNNPTDGNYYGIGDYTKFGGADEKYRITYEGMDYIYDKEGNFIEMVPALL